MKNFICFYFSFLILASFTCSLSAQSLVDKSKSLVDKSKSLVEKSKSLVEKSKSLVDKSKSLVDKSKSLVDKSKSLVDKSKSLVDKNNDAIGTHSIIVSRTKESINENTISITTENVEEDVYVNNYGAFLKAVISAKPQAIHEFVTYFTDWQWSGQEQDFFSYSADRAANEKKIELCYENALKKFGVGTAIVASTWAVTFIVPGGTICYASVLIIAKSTTWGAVSGAVFDGIIAGGSAIISGRSTDEIIYETINGAAEGYLFGAVAGVTEGAIHVGILARNAKTVSDYILFGDKLYNKSGKLVRDLSAYPKSAINTILRNLDKGDDIVKAISRLDIDYERLHSYMLALQKGEMTSKVFWDLAKMNGLPKELCEEYLSEKMDFGKYLRTLIGDPPSEMVDPHAHHVLPKVGRGDKQKKLIKLGQEILREYGIDPITGPENLCWAPNRVAGQHSEQAIEEIVEGLKLLKESGATREEVVEFLKQMGQKAAARV